MSEPSETTRVRPALTAVAFLFSVSIAVAVAGWKSLPNRVVRIFDGTWGGLISRATAENASEAGWRSVLKADTDLFLLVREVAPPDAIVLLRFGGEMERSRMNQLRVAAENLLFPRLIVRETALLRAILEGELEVSPKLYAVDWSGQPFPLTEPDSNPWEPVGKGKDWNLLRAKEPR